MSYPKIILSSTHAYHICIKTNNSEFFKVHKDSCWDIFIKYLSLAKEKYKFELHGFVLMDNHYHLILSTPNSNISSGMRYLHTQISKKIGILSNNKNHLFGRRYFWKILEDESYYLTAMKYIYRNPVRAGICANIELYKYTNFHFKSQASIFSDKYEHIDFLSKEGIEWLNTPFDIER